MILIHVHFWIGELDVKEGDTFKVYWYPISLRACEKIINHTSEIINHKSVLLHLGCYWLFFTRFKVGQIYDLWCMISDLWFFRTLLDLWGINRPWRYPLPLHSILRFKNVRLLKSRYLLGNYFWSPKIIPQQALNRLSNFGVNNDNICLLTPSPLRLFTLWNQIRFHWLYLNNLLVA